MTLRENILTEAHISSNGIFIKNKRRWKAASFKDNRSDGKINNNEAIPFYYDTHDGCNLQMYGLHYRDGYGFIRLSKICHILAAHYHLKFTFRNTKLTLKRAVILF